MPTRRVRAASFALSLVAATAACDGTPTELTLEPNVAVFAAADVSQTDDAVLVGGTPQIDFGDGVRAILFSHQTRYVYRGVFEHLDSDREKDDSWYMDLRRSRTVEQRADTLFRRAVDFGDVTLDGTLADRLVNPNPFTAQRGDSVWAFDGYLTFRAAFYSYRSVLGGSDVSFRHEPAYDNIVAGRPVTLVVEGSDEVDPASASFALQPGPQVVDLWNGETVDFENSMPELRHDRPLALELDRPVERDRAIIRIFYAPPNDAGVSEDDRRLASAAFMLLGRSQRIVIPPSALSEMASHLPEPFGRYIIQISEYLVEDDVMDVRYSDGEEETFSVIRTSSFRIYATMAR